MTNKIEELRKRLIDLDYAYRTGNAKVSDADYDKLMKELEALEYAAGDHDPDSPTNRMLLPKVKGLQKRKHLSPMLSIDNVYSDEDAVKWVCNNFDLATPPILLLEPKVDGCAVNLIYKKGKLYTALTRGNGREGYDITPAIRRLDTVPWELKDKNWASCDWVEVRGELYIRPCDFDDTMQKEFANTRSVVAGVTTSKDMLLAYERELRFVCHGVGVIEASGTTTPLQMIDIYAGLEDCGFNVIFHRVVDITGDLGHVTTCSAYQKALQEFDTDGVVLKYNSRQTQRRLGSTSKHVKWALAIKTEQYEAETTLKGVEWQVSRYGRLTPVAILDTVEIAGTKVTRASLCNMGEIERLNIGVGDTVVVEKSGKIIPKIIRVVKKCAPCKLVELPKICPVCSTELTYERSAEDAYTIPICSGPIEYRAGVCPEALAQQLAHFVSQEAMDIRGVGIELCRLLVNKFLVRNTLDLYKLHKLRDHLLWLPRMAEKSVDNLLKSIEDSKQRPVKHLIVAMGLPLIGKHVADAIEGECTETDRDAPYHVMFKRHYGENNKLFERPICIGSTYAVRKSWDDNINIIKAFFERASKLGINTCFMAKKKEEKKSAEVTGSKPLTGMFVVATGKFLRGSRTEINNWLQSLGADVQDSFNGKTNLVIYGDDAGSKKTKAEAKGIKTQSEQEFVNWLNMGTT